MSSQIVQTFSLKSDGWEAEFLFIDSVDGDTIGRGRGNSAAVSICLTALEARD